MLIVDSQIHLWQGASAPAHHRSAPYFAEEAVARMDEAGVARAVNCPAIWDERANDYAVEAASTYPDRLGTMGWFPLDEAPETAFVERFLSRPGTLGLRFVFARPQDCAALASGDLDWIWEVAGDLGLPVSFGAAPSLLSAIGAVAERFPKARFMLDHLGVGPFDKLPAAMDHIEALVSLAALPNFALKASATPSMSNQDYPFVDVSPFLERLFRAFGRDRLFWGTDITRMHIPLEACVSQFTDHLPWLKGDELARVMGAALCDWLSWPIATPNSSKI